MPSLAVDTDDFTALRAAWPAFDHSLTAGMIGFTQPDAHEGLKALNEKRSPQFRGGAGVGR